MAQGWICDECSRGVAKDNGTTGSYSMVAPHTPRAALNAFGFQIT